MKNLLDREAATKATLARYRHKAFSWKDGVTCVHMARYHLRQLGYRPRSLPRVASLVGAQRALRDNGWQNVADMLDEILPAGRIAPARMLLGDLAVIGTDDGIGAIVICAGPHKLLGWREDNPALVVVDVTLDVVDGAWRV